MGRETCAECRRVIDDRETPYINNERVICEQCSHFLDGIVHREDTVQLRGDGSFSLECVGESNCRDALEIICGGSCEDGHHKITTAILVHDDENPYDSLAIRVEIEGSKVGHLSREDAGAYRRQLRKAGLEGSDGLCCALISGGWDRGGGDVGHFGVRLDVGDGRNA